MGLDTTHDAWHGAYSAFMRWREKVAELAGIPPLWAMEGFFTRGDYCDPLAPYAEKNKQYPATVERAYAGLPILWNSLQPSPLHALLYHSDCEGELTWQECGGIADELEKLVPAMDHLPENGGHIGVWADKTRNFIAGCRLAYDAKESMEFH